MTVLTRYLLRQNLGLLLIICGIGLGVYVFVELFDRLDDFLEAGASSQAIISYFLFRIPFILAQIFPAVFLVSLLVQMGLMMRNRELLALQACAVSLWTVTKSIVLYALVLSLVQLFFSEALGVAGYRAAEKIRSEELRNRKSSELMLPNVWFREGNFIVHMEQLKPVQRKGQKLSIYVIDAADAGKIVEIVRAEEFFVQGGVWQLRDVARLDPGSFSRVTITQETLALATDPLTFKSVDPKASMQSLPVWQLGEEIRRLKDSGSNIERLETAWHSKMAYATSLVVMALLALGVISFFHSLYMIIPLGLVLTFFYYAVFVVFVSAGENGVVPPAAGAWAANLFFGLLAGGQLLYGRSRLG